MKKIVYDKTFFDNSFSTARMKPYYERYPGNERKALQHIIKRGELVTPDKINGELTMGFWVLLFNAKYERYLWKDIRKAFPNMPKTKRQRKYISAPLNVAKKIRPFTEQGIAMLSGVLNVISL